ncbi:RIP metalloprotease RseP [candidate division KSB1 bacterium]|nr:RIP metalloprotease RseP [candidate division KSB1 bacterium]MBL7093438.1 RIP metalloprotease RseP [candidate division KSB1 bacterium]
MLEAIFRLIISLGILVFIHEFGHFMLAKFVGIRVERFSLGFPPRMFGKKYGDTDYCISWIPLGGYVKMSGMIDESMDAESIKGEPWEFMSKPVWQRFLVIFAGPLMNLILAVLLFAGVTYITGLKESLGVVVGKISSEQIKNQTGLQNGDIILSINDQSVKTWGDVDAIRTETEYLEITYERNSDVNTTGFSALLIDSLSRSLPAVVGSMNQDYPAMRAGMQVNDKIVAINGIPIKTWHELTDVIHSRPDSALLVEWIRGQEKFASTITPHKEKIQGKEIGLIGISFAMQEKQLGFFASIEHGFNYCVQITQLTYHYVKLVFKGEQSFKDAFGGPIMIAKLAKDSAREGESNFIAFIAFLSLNLGLLNLLPIPVLDGGHIVFLLVEGIIRRPLPTKAKLVIQQVGMVILIAFMLFVIVNDIGRLSQ